MANLSLEQRQLCDIQGRLFELALKNGYDCPMFIQAFMNSRTAAALDDTYDRLQWAGEEYILEELNDEVDGLKKAGHALFYRGDVLDWLHLPLLALLHRREQQGHFPGCRSGDHE